jgi:hypothetical protein
MMEALRSSEMSVLTRATRPNIQEDSIPRRLESSNVSKSSLVLRLLITANVVLLRRF